jgi:hypothetical protein
MRIESERAEVRDRLGQELDASSRPTTSAASTSRWCGSRTTQSSATRSWHAAPRRAICTAPTRSSTWRARPAASSSSTGSAGDGGARSSAALPARCLRFVNIDPAALFHVLRDVGIGEYVADVPEALRTSTILEITEKSVIDDFAHCREVIARLRSHGFKVAVDDAGAGYSGLQTIVETEPDYIKLDISLTRNLDQSLVKQKLVRTLSAFCRDAGIELIAEGVETRRSSTPCCASRCRWPRGTSSRSPARRTRWSSTSTRPRRTYVAVAGLRCAGPRRDRPAGYGSDVALLTGRGRLPGTMSSTSATPSTTRSWRCWLWRALRA